MVTCYPGGGAKYVKHLDNPDDNGRKLTLILYLNESWVQGDGGELRLYNEMGGYEDVAPLMNRLVIFWADLIPHEVLPAHTERYAVTLWYYDCSCSEAAAAIQKQLKGEQGVKTPLVDRDYDLGFYQSVEEATEQLCNGGGGFAEIRNFLEASGHDRTMEVCVRKEDQKAQEGNLSSVFWLKGNEEKCQAFSLLRERCGLVHECVSGRITEVDSQVGALDGVQSRTRVMRAPTKAYFSDAEMVRFSDNPDQNGRVLTILYVIGPIGTRLSIIVTSHDTGRPPTLITLSPFP